MTVTFAISILKSLNTDLKACQAVILALTRELAVQIVKVASSLGGFLMLLRS